MTDEMEIQCLSEIYNQTLISRTHEITIPRTLYIKKIPKNLETATKLNLLTLLRTHFDRKWNRDTPASSIFRNMAILSSGTIVGKVIGIFTVPIITRIYLPDHFGVLSIFTALVALLVPFGTLRYTMAIPLPKNDGLVANLVVLCGLFLFIVSTLVFVIIGLLAPAVLATSIINSSSSRLSLQGGESGWMIKTFFVRTVVPK